MALFSRKSAKHSGSDEIEEALQADDARPSAGGAAGDGADAVSGLPATPETPDHSGDVTEPGAGGPWDVLEVDGLGNRIDFGALWLPRQHRIMLESADGGGPIVAAAIDDGGITMRLQAFAAPKSAGLWDEIRDELAEQASSGNGEVHDIPGPFGRELLVTMRGKGGAKNSMRFWGVDGPRWFLRGVLTGSHVLDEPAAERFAGLFADVVVVRGPEARAPRELLELHPPEMVSEASEQTPSFDPMHRGPEITEVR